MITAFVTTIGDQPNFDECIRCLKRQSASDILIDVIDRVAPMSAAFQQMIERCTTDLYVQVDEDMHLQPWAVHRLRAELEAAPQGTAIACAPLWDRDVERAIYGVKVYRHEIVRRYPYTDAYSCEMEQLSRLRADGFGLLTIDEAPMLDQALLEVECFGLHGAIYNPYSMFLRWKRLVVKQRKHGWLKWIEAYYQKHLARWRATGDPVHLAAVLGIVAGHCGDLPPEAEADFRVVDPDWERLKTMIAG